MEMTGLIAVVIRQLSCRFIQPKTDLSCRQGLDGKNFANSTWQVTNREKDD
jgi:hypothetical protein